MLRKRDIDNYLLDGFVSATLRNNEDFTTWMAVLNAIKSGKKLSKQTMLDLIFLDRDNVHLQYLEKRYTVKSYGGFEYEMPKKVYHYDIHGYRVSTRAINELD